MYIALWKSFAHQIKTAMKIITDNNMINGTAELVIRTNHSFLNNLLEKLEELDFDVDICCKYTSKTIKTLQDAEGNDKQTLLKLYNALVLIKVNAFSSAIRAYKAAVVAKDKKLDFTKLTTIASAKYTSLKMCD
eukprot:8671337-Ditylum_brightwellii.AAC.1